MAKIYYIPYNRRLLLDSFFVVKSETMYLTTVNDRLSALGAYFKTKAFGWELVRTGCLIRSGRLLKKSKKKKKKKSVTQVNFLQKSQFLQKLISKIVLFLLFKLASRFNWVLEQT